MHIGIFRHNNNKTKASFDTFIDMILSLPELEARISNMAQWISS